MATVYVVGRRPAHLEWELEAVYGSQAEAETACDQPGLFYVPMVLGERFESSAERRARIERGDPPAQLPCVYPRG